MTLNEIKSMLCFYDPRNTDYNPYNNVLEKHNDCSCDNCYYGRTKLAEEIIMLKAELSAYNNH